MTRENEGISAAIYRLETRLDDLVSASDRNNRGSFSRVFGKTDDLETDVAGVGTTVTTTATQTQEDIAEVADGLGTLTPTTIFPLNSNSLGSVVTDFVAGLPGAAAWPADVRAIFYPFFTSASLITGNAFYTSGGVTNGNVQVGIYDADRTLLTSSGFVAQAASEQDITLPSITLEPGQYWVGVHAGTGTGEYQSYALAQAMYGRAFNVRYQTLASSSTLLPSAAEFTGYTTYVPLFGVYVTRAS